MKNKTSSERRKQFSFDDENEQERGANSPPTNGRIDETTGTQADSRHKNMGDKKPQNWTIDLVHTMSPPDLNQLSHFTRQDELLKRSTHVNITCPEIIASSPPWNLSQPYL